MKKIKKLDSNTLAFLFILVFMFVGVGGKYLVNVLADSGSNIIGESFGSGKPIPHQYVSSRSTSITGVRVTLVDENGQRINASTSKNFFTSDSLAILNSNVSSIYFSSNRSRVETGVGFSRGSIYKDIYPLPSGMYLSSHSYPGASSYFKSIANNSESIRSFVNQYFQEDVKYDELSCDEKQNLYLLVEPVELYWVSNGEKAEKYVGTVSEIAEYLNEIGTVFGPYADNYNDSYCPQLSNHSDWGFNGRCYTTSGLRIHTKSFSKYLSMSANDETGGFTALTPVSNFEIGNGQWDVLTGNQGYGVGLVWLKEAGNSCSSCTFSIDKSVVTGPSGITNDVSCCDYKKFDQNTIGMTEDEFYNSDWYKNYCTKFCDIHDASHYNVNEGTHSGPLGQNCCEVTNANYNYLSLIASANPSFEILMHHVNHNLLVSSSEIAFIFRALNPDVSHLIVSSFYERYGSASHYPHSAIQYANDLNWCGQELPTICDAYGCHIDYIMAEDTIRSCVRRVNESFQDSSLQATDADESAIQQEILTYIQNTYPEYYNTVCAPSQVNNCQYYVRTDCGDDCDNQDYGYVQDIGINDAEWNCIYQSQTASDPWKNQYVKNIASLKDNPYCTVYCREDVQYKFPSDTISVLAGRYFTVGIGNTNLGVPDWSPIEYTGNQDCRTTPIDLEGWLADYTAANDAVNSTWDAYANAVAMQKSIATETKTYSECSTSEATCTTSTTCSGTVVNGDCVGGQWSSSTSCPSANHYTYTQGKWGKYTQTASSWNECSATKTKKPEDPGVASKKAAYDAAIRKRNELLSLNRACTRWVDVHEYTEAEFSPTLSLSYEEEKYAIINQELDRTQVSNTSINQYRDDEGSISTDEFIENANYYSGCNENSGCSNGTTQYYAHTMVYRDSNRVYSYQLPEGIYPYILKPSNQSVHVLNTPGFSPLNYIDLGFSNLPVSLSASIGYHQDGLKITTLSYGPQSKMNQFVMGQYARDPYVDQKCATDYTCDYYVKNEIQCDPTVEDCGSIECDPCVEDCGIPRPSWCDSDNPPDNPNPDNPNNPDNPPRPGGIDPGDIIGLNVIWRPISLNSAQEAFPDEDGEGRRPGANWSSSDVNQYIVNNRGVQGGEVYSKEPMYHIEMTPAVIQEIRAYNKKQQSYGGYGDFNLQCGSDGRQCESEFIRNSEFSKYITGCGTGVWNKCDHDDGITRRR